MGFTCSGKKFPHGKLHLGEPQLSSHCKTPTPGVSGWWVLFLNGNLCQPWDLGDN